MEPLLSIGSKSESYKAYEAGHFGNRLRSFSTNELSSLPMTIDLGIRYKGSTILPRPFKTELSYWKLVEEYCYWTEVLQIPDEDIWIGESLPTSRLVLQGEVMRDEGYYSLLYTTGKGFPNRTNTWPRSEEKRATGLLAKSLLETYLWPKSYDNLQAIWDKWPDGVIEFSAVDFECGIIPGHNTVFWEVRDGY